ncbi:Gfo/Idh/MocA family protein [Halomicronema sp. CCY15110]|uniref:Gfo/Idh/MocA family protein n=1 Tax=Halomicronema sp. CCY15110 TaxID=2767773 RepID=UPI001950C2F0|nr:Gfo/Idh/MocA family oxidoreductase [Halomicronema sp. CCY15110]
MTLGLFTNLGRSLRVGIVGTGFAAKARAMAIAADPRAAVLAVTGHHPGNTRTFAAAHDIPQVFDNWQTLVQQPDLDGVFVCNVNRDHSAVAQAALEADKFVVVEYPLAIAAAEAAALIELAAQRQRLLHIEHIELLGGLHQTMLAHLPKIGTPHYVRYCTAVPQRPAPEKWTYNAELFGFPLAGALSRLHRLTNLFGAVASVACQMQMQPAASGHGSYYRQLRCLAQLQFHSGVLAEVLYAKGEATWRSQRWMEVEGDRGAIVFDGDQGTLLSAEEATPLELESRRGLFARDTTAVLDALIDGTPLYVTPQESLYALQVAAAAEAAAQTGNPVKVTAPYPGATLKP